MRHFQIRNHLRPSFRPTKIDFISDFSGTKARPSMIPNLEEFHLPSIWNPDVPYTKKYIHIYIYLIRSSEWILNPMRYTGLYIRMLLRDFSSFDIILLHL